MAFGRRVQGELPVQAIACWQGEGGGEPVGFTDPAEIRALFNALASVRLTGYAELVRTDDYTSFSFTFADGSAQVFSFDSMTVEVREGDSWKFHDIHVTPEFETLCAIAQEITLKSYQ